MPEDLLNVQCTVCSAVFVIVFPFPLPTEYIRTEAYCETCKQYRQVNAPPLHVAPPELAEEAEFFPGVPLSAFVQEPPVVEEPPVIEPLPVVIEEPPVSDPIGG